MHIRPLQVLYNRSKEEAAKFEKNASENIGKTTNYEEECPPNMKNLKEFYSNRVKNIESSIDEHIKALYADNETEMNAQLGQSTEAKVKFLFSEQENVQMKCPERIRL